MKKSKSPSKRSKHPTPNLVPKLNTRKRQHLLDHDYLDKLSPEELAFLDKFTAETVNASFKKKDGKFSGNLYKKQSLKTGTL